MQVTRIHFAVASAAALVTTAACGQVTGLSDDYLFDLTEGGAAAVDASADSRPGDEAAVTDAAGDARDATKACSVTETTSALQRLGNYNGTTTCKTCLAGKCCTDVDPCTRSSECSRVLSCKLDCTERSGTDRTSCSKTCNNNNGGPPPLYINGVGACGTAACASECQFQ